MHRRRFLGLLGASAIATIDPPEKARSDHAYPSKSWTPLDPAQAGFDPDALDRLARDLGGNGCLIQNGRMVASWGNPAQRSDWFSSAKPVFSTLLWFAVAEGLVSSVDEPIARWGWSLREKDRPITFRHLANMTSGYARPEGPGLAFSYNDFAIQLYQQTLFDRVYRDDPTTVFNHPRRLGPLQFEDRPTFNARRRLLASPRDFARLAWFWLQRGRWGKTALLPSRFFDSHLQPDVPSDLPHTAEAETDDYLGIGSFGGGSDHFTRFGPGIYGFNFWFNASGRTHPDRLTWPDAPADTLMTIGFGGNCAALFPSKRLAAVCAKGNWGTLDAGQPDSTLNLRLRQIASLSP